MTRCAAGGEHVCGYSKTGSTAARHAILACKFADSYSGLEYKFEPPRKPN